MRFPAALPLCLFFTLIFVSSSCRKEQLLTSGGEVKFSTDTLTFDTVFTQFASFTMAVRLYNPQNQRINLSSVRLDKGENSFFKLNVNGISGQIVRDLEMEPNDSLYVFATVNIDPNNEENPFIIEDKLIATVNGNDYSIPMIAYGQNAHYIIDSAIAQNSTWENDLPFVIMHNAQVVEGYTLTINKGCRIYVHADSRLFIDGTLKINGTKEDSVVFQGDRLDRAYFGHEGYPGEWGGLYFTSSSSNNELNWTVLKNCGNATRIGNAVVDPAAIQVNTDSVWGITPQLKLHNVIIENSIGFGILSLGAHIEAENCLINDCGAQALAILEGGKYSFKNCNFINYQPKKLSHIDNPTVAVLNYRDISNTEYVAGDLSASFSNCIIYGSIDQELFCDKRDGASYDTKFENCLIQFQDDTLPIFVQTSNCLLNQDPQFEDASKWNFRPKAGSPLIDNGVANGVTTDLDGKIRSGSIDIGAYEYQ